MSVNNLTEFVWLTFGGFDDGRISTVRPDSPRKRLPCRESFRLQPIVFVSELYVNEAAWGAHEATEHSKTSVGALIPALQGASACRFIPFLAKL